jgi:hypothetical protein
LASARVLAARAALLGLVLASGACFRPKVVSGGFLCDTTTGAKACPDNFVCISGKCVTPPTDGGTDAPRGGSGGAGGHAGAGGHGGGGGGGNVDAGPDLGPCLPTVSDVTSCSSPSDAGLCDPVCNVGCADKCHDKCSVDNSGALKCNPLNPASAAAAPVGILANCSQFVDNASQVQTDNCAPGTVCLGLECSARCYQFCRTSADCINGASCSRDAGGGHSFCDVPPVGCDPTSPESCSGASSGAMGCYLGTDTIHTFCDCPFNGTTQGGGVQTGQPCTDSRQCTVGEVCFDPLGQNNPKCLKVCHLPGDGGADTDCSGGAIKCGRFSTRSGANQTYGYCSQ